MMKHKKHKGIDDYEQVESYSLTNQRPQTMNQTQYKPRKKKNKNITWSSKMQPKH